MFDKRDVAAQQLLAIGASAGGPAAIVLIQHVDQVFAAGMADWLTLSSGVPVRLARDGGLKQMRERGFLTPPSITPTQDVR